MRSFVAYVTSFVQLALAAVLVAASMLPAIASEAPNDLHNSYAKVLSVHVNERGMVDYPLLQNNPADLVRYLGRLGALEVQDVAAWPESDRIALYLNAYNAFTLKAIIAHYPIQPSFLASLRFPENSIRQIAGVWDELEWELVGQTVTLEDIEHEILRKRFREPRIHMALVCAARGCPPLRAEPYAGTRLDAQLDDQTARLLSDPAKFRIDRERSRVYLSPIFKWFGEDFVPGYEKKGPEGVSGAKRAVLGFVAEHTSEADARYLRAGGYRTLYLDYDWSLNEQ